MSTLIGRTFSYTHHGVTADRKVIQELYEGSKRLYRLLNLVTKERTTAIADIFDRIFKHRSSMPVVRDKKNKGKTIRSKQLQNIFE
jgi:hypothetical protein